LNNKEKWWARYFDDILVKVETREACLECTKQVLEAVEMGVKVNSVKAQPVTRGWNI